MKVGKCLQLSNIFLKRNENFQKLSIHRNQISMNTTFKLHLLAYNLPLPPKFLYKGKIVINVELGRYTYIF